MTRNDPGSMRAGGSRQAARTETSNPTGAALVTLCSLALSRPLLRRLPWQLRSVLAGAGATAALTLAYALERQLRSEREGPVDYDDSLVPGRIVVSILHLPHVTNREEDELGLALRWSYGSIFGLWLGLLRGRLREPLASLVFGCTLMSATLTMFPLLGRTPPPWRWPRGFLATSFATHLTYVMVGSVLCRARHGNQWARTVQR
jgi:hypothetical protein